MNLVPGITQQYTASLKSKHSLYRATLVLHKTQLRPVLWLPREGWLSQSPHTPHGWEWADGQEESQWDSHRTLLFQGSLGSTHCCMCIKAMLQFTHTEDHLIKTCTPWIIDMGYKSSAASVFSYKSRPRTNPWLMFGNTPSRLRQWELRFVKQSSAITKYVQCS